MATVYVRKTGNDSTGTGSTGNPYLTITKGLDSAPAGTVIVGNGTYNEGFWMDTGQTLQAENTGLVLVRASSGNAINGNGINNVVIDGLDIKTTGNHGIEIQNSHHITIRNCISHENPNSGISLPWGEFFTVEDCVCYGNGRGGWFSGITMYQSRNITGDTVTAGPRNIIRNCLVYDNWTTGGSTDGNGILMDDWQHTLSYGPNPEDWLGISYPYGGLVENCVAYGNGNKGIGITWSDHIVIRNNTCYKNGIDGSQGTWRGDLSNQAGVNNTFVNNISVADNSGAGQCSYNTAIGNYAVGSNGEACTGTIWYNNLTYNTNSTGSSSLNIDGPGCVTPTTGNGNILAQNPDFVGAPTDLHLQATSPARNAGTATYGLPSFDAEGNTRVVGGTVDLGPYEYVSSFTIDDADALKVGASTVTAVYYGSALIWGA
jgi:serralysin